MVSVSQRHHAASLDVDENRFGLWTCSGNVPAALSVLMRETCRLASGARSCVSGTCSMLMVVRRASLMLLVERSDNISVVLTWFEELRERVPSRAR